MKRRSGEVVNAGLERRIFGSSWTASVASLPLFASVQFLSEFRFRAQ